jgi:hypothetical protein
MGLFGKRTPKVVDGSLPDGPWLRASESMYKATVEPYYGSPETMAKGGEERHRQADYGTALFFYAKSIDMLHSQYGFLGMERRRPSSADAAIIDGYAESLAATLQAHPEAPIADCAGTGRRSTLVDLGRM